MVLALRCCGGVLRNDRFTSESAATLNLGVGWCAVGEGGEGAGTSWTLCALSLAEARGFRCAGAVLPACAADGDIGERTLGLNRTRRSEIGWECSPTVSRHTAFDAQWVAHGAEALQFCNRQGLVRAPADDSLDRRLPRGFRVCGRRFAVCGYAR